jgi:hypothetical protein
MSDILAVPEAMLSPERPSARRCAFRKSGPGATAMAPYLPLSGYSTTSGSFRVEMDT